MVRRVTVPSDNGVSSEISYSGWKKRDIIRGVNRNGCSAREVVDGEVVLLNQASHRSSSSRLVFFLVTIAVNKSSAAQSVNMDRISASPVAEKVGQSVYGRGHDHTWSLASMPSRTGGSGYLTRLACVVKSGSMAGTYTSRERVCRSWHAE